MMNIDIERLIDAVAACNEAYNEYCYSSKTLYRGPFEEITTRKIMLIMRERCRKNIEAKKDPHALKNLPVGAVIRFTLHTGESIELLKHAAAYQFKRPFWFCQSSGRYMPATRIPANYEVVTA